MIDLFFQFPGHHSLQNDDSTNNEVSNSDLKSLSLADLEALEATLLRRIQADLVRSRNWPQQQQQPQKRNYNLDHLARMNFRRSFRAAAGQLNTRHILGSL